MNEYLEAIVDVEIDRPLGSRHPEYNFIYPVNYGYIPNTTAPDGEEIDAYVLGEFEPIKKYRGRVIAVIKRKNHLARGKRDKHYVQLYRRSTVSLWVEKCEGYAPATQRKSYLSNRL